MHDRRIRPKGARSNVGRSLGIAGVAIALTPAFAATAFAGPSNVLLGTAGNFAVLGGTGMTNTGPSTILGDIGSSPTHSETGFDACPGASDCVSLTGANHNVADPNDAVTQQAKADLTTAYLDAFGRTGGNAISAPLGGGGTLVSGLYTSAADLFVGGDLTLDAGGDPNSVFIFQAKTGTLKTAAGTSEGIANTRVLLTNGAQACNVYWQVGSSATIETYTQFVGTILANESITVNTLATIDSGRALARNGAVTLDTNTIKAAPCTTTPGSAGSSGGETTTTAPGGGTTSGPSQSPRRPPPARRVASATAAQSGSAGNARLQGPSGPVTGPFTVSVTGRHISKVVFYVDGRRRTTVRAKEGRKRFSLKINPRRQSRRVHQVTARVFFTTKSGTPTATRRLTYRRPVAPARRTTRAEAPMRAFRAGLVLACLLVIRWGAAPAPAAQSQPRERAVRAVNASGPLGDERLSDERRLSRYAGAVARATVRSRPRSGANAVGCLHFLSEDGAFEVYPVLESQVDRARAGPGFASGCRCAPTVARGWVPRDALGPLKVVRTMLRVNRATLRATLYRGGRRIWSSPVGIGKAATPTPAGHFWIRSRLRGLAGQPRLRTVRLRHRRILGPQRVAGRRGDRHPRNRRARADSGTPVARMHPRSERGDRPPLAADADRDAGQDPLAGRRPRRRQLFRADVAGTIGRAA